MGYSMDGESDKTWQDVSRKGKDRSINSRSAASGLEAGDMAKKSKVENMRMEREQTQLKVMIT